jgi:hypothetical protein
MSRPEFAPLPSSPSTTGVSDALALDRNWILGAVIAAQICCQTPSRIYTLDPEIWCGNRQQVVSRRPAYKSRICRREPLKRRLDTAILHACNTGFF